MMKKTYYEQGITLVALVITIVIMIILAGISLNLVLGENGIAIRAKQGSANYIAASDEESSMLDRAEQDIGRLIGEKGKWSLLDGGIIAENGEATEMQIGDSISGYNHKDGATRLSITSLESVNGHGDQTFNLKDEYYWKILGVNENGEILITTSNVIRPDREGSSYGFILAGENGIINAESELNRLCELFGQGKIATGARSITVEDINKVTGYNPVTAKYDENEVGEYGNKLEYSWGEDGEYPYYKSINGKQPNVATKFTEDRWSENPFSWFNGKEWKTTVRSTDAPEATVENKVKITELTSNYYEYKPSTSTASSKANNMIFVSGYWTATPYVKATKYRVEFGLMNMRNANEYNIKVQGTLIYYSGGGGSYGDSSLGIRPVVSLKSDIQIEKGDSDGKWVIK